MHAPLSLTFVVLVSEQAIHQLKQEAEKEQGESVEEEDAGAGGSGAAAAEEALTAKGVVVYPRKPKGAPSPSAGGAGALAGSVAELSALEAELRRAAPPDRDGVARRLAEQVRVLQALLADGAPS